MIIYNLFDNLIAVGPTGKFGGMNGSVRHGLQSDVLSVHSSSCICISLLSVIFKNKT